MRESTWADWGRHIEDELVGVAPVLLHAVTNASMDAGFDEIHCRNTEWTCLIGEEAVADYADEHWAPTQVVHVRELPGLRFDTLHGSVVVADVWNDTAFRFLRVKPGKTSLLIDTPLRSIADLVCQAERTPGSEAFPAFFVAAIGWQEVPLLRPRGGIHRHSTWTMEGPDGFEVHWAKEPLEYDLKGVRAVIRAFKALNDEQAREMAALRFERSREASANPDGVDVASGIAALEAYLGE